MGTCPAGPGRERPAWCARWSTRTRTALLGGGRRSRRAGEGDVVAQLFELADEASGFALRIAEALEVVAAQIVVALTGAEEAPDEVAQAVGHGNGGLVRAAPLGD